MAKTHRAKPEGRKSAGPTSKPHSPARQAQADAASADAPARTYFMRDFPVAAGRTRGRTVVQTESGGFRRGRIWA